MRDEDEDEKNDEVNYERLQVSGSYGLLPTLARRALFIVYQSAAPYIAERVRETKVLKEETGILKSEVRSAMEAKEKSKRAMYGLASASLSRGRSPPAFTIHLFPARPLANKSNASSSSSPPPWANESSCSSPFFQRQLFEALHNVESTIQLSDADVQHNAILKVFVACLSQAPVLSQGVDELPQVEGAAQVQTSIKAPFMGRDVHVGKFVPELGALIHEKNSATEMTIPPTEKKKHNMVVVSMVVLHLWYDPPMCQMSVHIIPWLLRSRNDLEEILALVEENRRKDVAFFARSSYSSLCEGLRSICIGNGYHTKDKKKAKNKQNRARDGKDKVKS
ncbi:hypothetical protein Tco_1474483 [Tanacetum coccineum]